MQLGISSAADPTATADELVDACLRRGLSGLELRHGDRAARPDGIAAALGRCTGEAVQVVALLVDVGTDHTAHRTPLIGSGVPVMLRSASGARAALDAAAELRAAGSNALPLLQGPADEWLQYVGDHPFAWQVDDSVTDPAADAARILTKRARLAYLRLVGGGPETALQHDRGIGPLMRRLALAGYAGPLVVSPSSSRYRIAWSVWLGRRGGWGCGSSGTPAAGQPITITADGSMP
jgi:hypothetical protein